MLASILGAQTAVAGAIKCILLLGSISVQAQSDIPHDVRGAWLSLLHYRSNGGKWISEVQDSSFFLDAEGSRDPEREWTADRRAFLLSAEKGQSAIHAQCRFPARFALMKNALGWLEGDAPNVDCPEFKAHQRNLSAKSLSVVFVSGYLNNPASAFGHTMLYLGGNTELGAMLADYAVTFEADTDGMSPAKYLPRGLFGGLVARFRVEPLHRRVRRYEREEQRDLWLFPLQVRQEEIDRLVQHLWELKDVTFRYGFFEGNCAQKILALIHAVAPEHVVLPYRNLAVLPSEAARHLAGQIGLVAEPIRRPSLRRQYSQQVAKLNPLQMGQLKQMIGSRTVVEGASASTLSATLLWSELETPYRAFRRAAETEDHDDFVWRRALWTSLVGSDDSTAGQLTGLIEKSGPSLLQAHRPSLLALRGGYRSGSGPMLSVGARWLLHGAVDPQVGYPPVSTLEVARVELGLSSEGGIFVEEATAVRIESLVSASGLESPLAWKIDIGARRLAHDGDSSLHVGAEVGIGAGAALLRPNYSVALYSMLGARPGATLASSGISFLPAGIWSAGLLLRFPEDVRARVSAEYSLSLSAFKGGAALLNAVVRKGLTRDLDLELAATVGTARSGATLGFASFH